MTDSTVGEHRRRPRHARSRRSSECRCSRAVITSSPGSTPTCEERDRDCIGAGSDADGVPRAAVTGEGAARTPRPLPEDEPAARRARGRSPPRIVANGAARLAREIEERNAQRVVPVVGAVLAIEVERPSRPSRSSTAAPAEVVLDLPSSRPRSRRCRSPFGPAGNGIESPAARCRSARRSSSASSSRDSVGSDRRGCRPGPLVSSRAAASRNAATASST